MDVHVSVTIPGLHPVPGSRANRCQHSNSVKPELELEMVQMRLQEVGSDWPRHTANGFGPVLGSSRCPGKLSTSPSRSPFQAKIYSSSKSTKTCGCHSPILSQEVVELVVEGLEPEAPAKELQCKIFVWGSS